MPDDVMITPANPQPLPPAGKIYPELDIQQKAKEPNKFLKILGGVASSALNFVAPGLGGIIGSVVGGNNGVGAGSTSSYVSLMEQQRQWEDQQKYSQIANLQQQRQQSEMMNSQQRNSMQLIGLQSRVGMQAQEFSTVSNLLKSRHDSEMTAVNNIKS